MPLYTVTSEDNTRLVKAASKAAALSYVTTPMFEVEIVSDPSDAADLVASGIKLETAIAVVDAPKVNGAPTPEQSAQAALLAETVANAKASK